MAKVARFSGPPKYIMKTIKVELDNKTVVIEKMPLGRYAEVLTLLNQLPEKIGGLDNLTSDEILRKLPSIIATSLPEVVNILSVATGLTIEEVNALGLDEVVRLAIAVYEVNNYRDIIERIKKAARPPETGQADKPKVIGSGGR